MPDKWYVNLPDSKGDDCGDKVPLEARALANDNVTPEAGRKMLWTLEPDPGNTDLRYLALKQRAKLEHDETTSDTNGYCKNTLRVPHVGGDRYLVKVRKEGQAPNVATTVKDIRTWRRIYYTVHYVDNTARGLYTRVKGDLLSGMAAGFVEMKEQQVAPTPESQLETVATTNDLKDLYGDSYPLQHKPWHLRIVIVKELQDAVTANKLFIIRHNTNDGNCVMASKANSYAATLTFDEDLLAQNWLQSARAFVFATPVGQPEKMLRTIDIANYVTRSDARHMVVDFNPISYQVNSALRGFPNTRTFAGGVFTNKYSDGLVAVQITYNKAGHGDVYNGHSIGNFCCVRYDRGGAQNAIDAAVLGTFVHETGHGVQQVVKQEQLYDNAGAKVTGVGAFDKNFTEVLNVNQGPWHTDDQGGQGDHCAHNATLNGAGKWAYDAGKGQLCTMYFSGHPERNQGVFCATCEPRLKRADLSRLNMIKKKWNDY